MTFCIPACTFGDDTVKTVSMAGQSRDWVGGWPGRTLSLLTMAILEKNALTTENSNYHADLGAMPHSKHSLPGESVDHGGGGGGGDEWWGSEVFDTI